MLKRKSKGQEEPQEITVRYAAGRMIFEVGDREFFLTESAAGSIFGRSVGVELERIRGQGDDASELRSLQNFVKVQRLMRKGLDLPKIAVVLGVPEVQVRQFYSKEVSRPHVESWGPNELEIERKRQAAEEMDFCREAPRERTLSDQEPPTPGERFVDLLQIRNLRRQGMNDDRMAEHLKLDKGEFSRFMEKNKKYLDLLL